MRVYVESNFVLELAFRQEQAPSCRELLALCARGVARLVLPSFSIAEPFLTVATRARERKRADEALQIQLGQLLRSEVLRAEAEALRSITALFSRSDSEELAGLDEALQLVLDIAEVVPLNGVIVRRAAEFTRARQLSPQDAMVLASVIDDLTRRETEPSCFLNRNQKDFDDPEVRARLDALRCRLIPRFDDGLGFVRSQT